MTEHQLMPVRRCSFEYLAGLYDTDIELVQRAWLDICLPNVATDIIRCSALTLTKPTWEIPVDGGDINGIEWREVRKIEPGSYAWYSTTEGFVEVSEEQQRQYVYDSGWLPELLRHSLGLAEATVDFIPGRLMFLGNFCVDGQPHPVFLARQLTSRIGFQKIHLGLQKQSQYKKGVVLTLSNRLNTLPPLPEQFAVLSISSLLSSGEPCSIESNKLVEFTRSTFGVSGVLEVSLQDLGSSAVMEAEGRTVWEINGEKRCHVLRLVYQAWLDGRKGVSTERLHEEGIPYSHPQNCFKDDAWPEYIEFKNKIWSIKTKPRYRR